MKKLILLPTLTLLAMADFTLVYQMDKSTKQIVQYKDAKHIKVTTKESGDSQAVTQYIIGNKRYMLISENGKKHLVDIDKMIEQMKQMQNMMGDSSKSKEPHSDM